MIEHFDGVIFDVDGVLEYQKRVYPGAVELIDKLRSHGMAVRILTNSTLKSRHTAASKLRAKGFAIQDEQVITASYQLPAAGELQAVRANFRYKGSQSSCSSGDYDDHDDLVFAVGGQSSW